MKAKSKLTVDYYQYKGPDGLNRWLSEFKDDIFELDLEDIDLGDIVIHHADGSYSYCDQVTFYELYEKFEN